MLAASLAIPLTAYAVMGGFSRYAADDYCTAGVLRTDGLLPAQSYWYVAWSGRFTFTFLVSTVEMLGARAVPLLPTAMLLIWLAVLAWAILPLLEAPRRGAALLAPCVLAEAVAWATLAGAPDVAQALYWQTGVLTYLLPVVLAAGLVGLLARWLAAPSELGIWWARLGLCVVLGLLAAGLSETSTSVEVALLLLALAGSVPLRQLGAARAARPYLASILVGALIGAAILAQAPGNAVRSVGTQHDLMDAVLATLAFPFFLVRHFLRPPTPFPALVAAGIACLVGLRVPSPAAVLLRRVHPVVVAAALVALVLYVIWAAVFPSFLVLGADPPERAQFIPASVLLAAIVAGGWLAGVSLRERGSTVAAPRWAGAAMVAAVLPPILSLVVFAQVPAAASYAARWDADDAQIRSQAALGATTVVVPPLPRYLNQDFIGPDPSDWFNQCVARYYGVPSLAASPTP